MLSSLGRLASLALAVTASSSSGGSATCRSLGALRPPAVPTQLQPPGGASLATRFRAQGTQVYSCKAQDAGHYGWALKGPDAQLLDESCAPAGFHFAGPTWKSSVDNSAVTAAKAAEAPSPAGSIPWLLLKTKVNIGKGILSDVVAVQRVDTTGGTAPAGGCDAASVGAERAVPYTAVYYFYKAPAPLAPAPGY
jgi:hypothetical protein